MDEFLGAILGALFELLAEVLLEFAFGMLAAALSRAARRIFVTTYRAGRLRTGAFVAIVGCAAGLLSWLMLPHPLVHPSRFHGLNLLVSPLVTGLVLGFLGQGIRRRGRRSVAIESFGYGFTFSLAVALVRFFLVK
ncbi:MAG TPA: hypothetical protein VG225_06555 [Terracidiphilus sp.]|jgi:hypothetical protein|nr:hypothetical protein [Terracidiphilus sp.]